MRRCSSVIHIAQWIDGAKKSLKTFGQHLGDQTHNLKAGLGWFDYLVFYFWLCKNPRRTCKLYTGRSSNIKDSSCFCSGSSNWFKKVRQGQRDMGICCHILSLECLQRLMCNKLVASLLIWRYLTLLFLVQKSCQFPTVWSIHEESRVILTCLLLFAVSWSADHQDPVWQPV